MLFHATAARFPEILQEEGYVLLDFYAPWCMPCRALEPVLDACTDALEDVLTAYSINTDTDASLAAQYDAEVLPTVVLLRNGQVIRRWERPEHDAITADLNAVCREN